MQAWTYELWETKPCEGIGSLRYTLGGMRGQEAKDTDREILNLSSVPKRDNICDPQHIACY